MKKETKKTLQKNDIAEIRAEEKITRETLANLRFNLRAGKTATIKEIRELKKKLAVLLTIINNHDNATK